MSFNIPAGPLFVSEEMSDMLAHLFRAALVLAAVLLICLFLPNEKNPHNIFV